MRSTLLLVPVLAMSCQVTSLPNNGGDGGACPATPASPGRGAASGAIAFTALSATELALQSRDLDGGLISTGVSIGLSEKAAGCRQPRASEPTDAGWALGLTLLSPGTPDIPVGEYPIIRPDGTTAALSDGGVTKRTASILGASPTEIWKSRDGVVTITRVQPCSIDGTFDVTMMLFDGGTPGSMTGTFQSVYCSP
jgi:hypothetical protein